MTLTKSRSRMTAGAPINVLDFGAVGDGVTDDTVAVQAAVDAGVALDWGSGTYLITTPLISTVAKVDWRGSGATLKYDGTYARAMVTITCAISQDHRVTGMRFDGNAKVNVPAEFVAATVSEAIALWPNIFLRDVECFEAYRATTAFSSGDGLLIRGGFAMAHVNGLYVHDCYMATGADVFTVEGIFGVSFSSNGSRRCRNVLLENYRIENVWSEDATYKFDQDGVRIFQEDAEGSSTCSVLNGVIKNVSNRAVKMHSAINGIVDNLYRELDSAVTPQQGARSNPDIDFVTAAGTVNNFRFQYDGAWHDQLIRNHTWLTTSYDYGGNSVSNVNGRILNAAGNDITCVAARSGDVTVNAEIRLAVNNISISGPVARFLEIIAGGAATATAVSLTSCSAEVTSEAVDGQAYSGRGRVIASNLHNTDSATPVPLGVGFGAGGDDTTLMVIGHNGFLPEGAITSFGGDSPDLSRVGAHIVGLAIPTDALTSSTDTVLLLAPVADAKSHMSGTVELLRGVSTTAGIGSLTLGVSKDATAGSNSAGHCVFSGGRQVDVSLITCTHGGVSRYGVRINTGGGGTVLARAMFTGHYLGSLPLRLVPETDVSTIAAFVQLTTFEQATSFLQPVKLPSYTVATLPTASQYTRAQIWVSDETGGASPAYSDGTNWKRYSDGATVS